MQHAAPVPENLHSSTSPGPVPESGTGAGRTFTGQNREVMIDKLRSSILMVAARKREKSVRMACATNAPENINRQRSSTGMALKIILLKPTAYCKTQKYLGKRARWHQLHRNRHRVWP